MDLIYTDANRTDIGVLLAYELDLAFGQDENDFECTVSSNDHCCVPGTYLYIEGTEYGGIVDAISNDTAAQEITYSGRTWQGILNSKVIQPDSGKDYLTLSGEANTVISTLLSRLGLGDLMQASTDNSELTITSYEMPRYAGGYDGIAKMLSDVGGKLLFSYQDGNIILSALPQHDYSQDEEFDSDLVDYKSKRCYTTVNHLICLGDGELAEREVIHLYADAEGNISQTQTFTGLEEYAETYDYSNAESTKELIKGGTERLKELWGQDELQIDFSGDSEAYDIGDIVGAIDNVTKIAVSAEIQKKIVTVKNGQVTISYEVGGLNNG